MQRSVGAGSGSLKRLMKDIQRRQWHPTPVLLPGKSMEEEPGRLQSMGSLRVGHD